jgi:isopenicillin-N epimerase
MTAMTAMTFGRSALVDWPLDPAVTYLNHGTVGVTPRRVRDVQSRIREEIERQPSRALLRDMAEAGLGRRDGEPYRTRVAAHAVAAFLGARGDDLVFVDNVTAGVTAVLRSFPFERGDEIVLSDLAYGGVARAAMHVARERGAVIRTATMPFPRGGADFAEAYAHAVTARTRLAIVDHITAESALVLPLADIARHLRARGVAVLADGAHAPGAIAVDIPSLGVDWYAGNLHKWGWVPRSSGILWAAPERQGNLHALVPSWGLDRGFTAEFDWPGTRDPSAHLSAPAAIALMHEWGHEQIRAYNHQLAWTGARRLAERWQTVFETPEAMIGTMATVTMPASLGTSPADAQALRDALLFEDQIEVQVHSWRDRIHVRISAQIYNDMADIERLADAVGRRVVN